MAKGRNWMIFDEKQRAVEVRLDRDRRRHHAHEVTQGRLQSGRLGMRAQRVPVHACDGGQILLLQAEHVGEIDRRKSGRSRFSGRLQHVGAKSDVVFWMDDLRYFQRFEST